MYSLLFVIGRLLAWTPLSLVKGFSWILGSLFFQIPSKRRHLLFSNLHHAFPDRSKNWLRHTAWKISQRTAEMGLFTLACPHFSKRRFWDSVEATPEVEAEFKRIVAEGKPIVAFGTHFSMIEAFNAWPGKFGSGYPETAIMYRPHRNPKIDYLIKTHRERAGLKLVSRREGVREIGEVLKRNGMGAVLFDQNTRDMGTLIPFFGRVTSATELPGLLAKKYQATPILLAACRSSFWKGEMVVHRLEAKMDSLELTLAANQKLEEMMLTDETKLTDWLWTHNRWKILFRPHERLGMEHRKKMPGLVEELEKTTRIGLVVPNWKSRENTAQEFIKNLRTSRPDAQIWLFADLETGAVDEVDHFRRLPESSTGLRKLSNEILDAYLDVMLFPVPEKRLENFAKQCRIPQRFGVRTEGASKGSLTDAWRTEAYDEWVKEADWSAFGEHFGLQVEA